MDPKVKSSPNIEPGARLRQARESRRLSIDDIAETLRLAPRIIAALEEDAYDRLPGPTYVRGYLRSYALFLELPPQPLIDAYNNRPESGRRTDMTAPAPVRQATSSDAMVRLGTAVVIVVVLGLATLWWSGHDTSVLRIGVPTPSEQSTASEATGGDRLAQESEPELTAEATTEPPEPEPPASARSENESSEGSTVTANAPSSTSTAAPRSPPAPPVDPDVPMSRLVLYLHEDSWADVRDAQQRRLLYETIPAGRVVTVEGVAPISVFLGNVEGVKVEFNGQEYDTTRHRRGEVARFTLGSPRG